MLPGLRISDFSCVVAGALLIVPLFPPAPADAQTQQQIDWCVNKGYVYSPNLQINGCTAALQSGRLSGKDLASAFNNRGNAYNDKNDYDRAIADFDQAIRLGRRSDRDKYFCHDDRGTFDEDSCYRR